jgi:hypothetical protein
MSIGNLSDMQMRKIFVMLVIALLRLYINKEIITDDASQLAELETVIHDAWLRALSRPYDE